MNARVLAPESWARWDAWLRDAEGATVRVASPYVEALRGFGYRAEILALENAEGFVGGGLLARRGMGLPGASILRSSGPLVLSDVGDPEAARALMEALAERARECGAASIEVSFRVPLDRAGALEEVLRSSGYRPTRPQGTFWIDLDRDSDEALLESFPKKVRRDVRKGLRDGLRIDASRDPSDFDAFDAAHATLGHAKGIDALPSGFGRRVLLPLADRGLGDLLVARFQEVARNFVFVGSAGTPMYTWGALAPEARDGACPPTGQATQFVAMCRARSAGAARYDLGGSPGPEPDPSHANYTVWRFKHDFGGGYVSFLGYWEATPRPAVARVASSLRAAKAVARKWTRR